MTLILVVLGLTVPVFTLHILFEIGWGQWIIYKTSRYLRERNLLTFTQSERIARWLDET